MSRADDASSAARQKAHELLSRSKRQEEERLESRAKQRQEEDAKTARLRALRLAKEAADKAARDTAKPRPSPKIARRSREP